MRARFAASVLVVAFVAFGTAGCAFITPQATTEIVETSDGLNATVGEIDVRNATLISEDGASASMLVTFVNPNISTRELLVQYTDGSTGQRVTEKVFVPGSASTSFGGEGAKQIILSNVTKPGSLFPVYLQYGSVEGVQLLVPVLNTSLPEYTGLAPTVSPTAAGTETPTPIPTPLIGTTAATPAPTATPAH